MSFSANIDDLVAENRNGLLGKRKSWSRVRLKQIATILNGFPFESAKFKKESGTPLIRIRDILPGRTETFYDGDFDPAFLVQRGEILIGMDGDFNCKEWTGEPALLNQRVCKITPDTNLFSKQFLKYVLPGYLSAINAETSSVTVKHLSSRTIGDIPLPLPTLDEQRTIVAEIEKQFTRLEAGVGALKRVQASLKRYRAAVLKAACEGKLVPTEAELAKAEGRSYETGEQLLQRILNERRKNWSGRGKYKEPAAPDTTNLPELPEGWAWARTEQLCEFITKGTTPSAEKMQSGMGEVPFIKVYNLTFTGLLNLNYKPVFISRKTHESELARSDVRAGDVLINIVGPPLGQVSIVPPHIHNANINQAIARFRVVFETNRKFMALCLMTEKIMRWATNRAKTTAGQSNLTLELCRDLPIPLPPTAEQKRIVEEVERRLSVIEGLEATISTNLQRATRLRQSILQKAFSPAV